MGWTVAQGGCRYSGARPSTRRLSTSLCDDDQAHVGESHSGRTVTFMVTSSTGVLSARDEEFAQTPVCDSVRPRFSPASTALVRPSSATAMAESAEIAAWQPLRPRGRRSEPSGFTDTVSRSGGWPRRAHRVERRSIIAADQLELPRSPPRRVASRSGTRRGLGRLARAEHADELVARTETLGRDVPLTAMTSAVATGLFGRAPARAWPRNGWRSTTLGEPGMRPGSGSRAAGGQGDKAVCQRSWRDLPNASAVGRHAVGERRRVSLSQRRRRTCAACALLLEASAFERHAALPRADLAPSTPPPAGNVMSRSRVLPTRRFTGGRSPVIACAFIAASACFRPGNREVAPPSGPWPVSP